MSNVMQDMAMDRSSGNVTMIDYDESVAKLRAMGAKNMERPPLPISPCIKVIATGEIHEWTQDFANRFDLCVNCDENGNTDPSTWTGRAPRGMPNVVATPPPVQAAPPPEIVVPADYSGYAQGGAPNMAVATEEFGIAPDFAKAYIDPEASQSAMPFTGMENYNASVDKVVDVIFTDLIE